MIYDRLADSVQKYAKVIIAFWLVILLCSSFFAIQSGDVMSYNVNDMAPTESESYKGLQILAEEYPAAAADSSTLPILVIYYEDTTQMKASQEFVDDLVFYLLDSEVQKKYPHIDAVLSMDPTSAIGKGIIMSILKVETNPSSSNPMADAEAIVKEVRGFIDYVSADTGYTGTHYVTGMSAISVDMSDNAMKDISKIDPFTILMILILVGLFFRSFVSSAAPPMVIGVAFVITMALIFGLGHFLNIFFITNMLILVAMMGAGCDYCIFIIARYREELRSGKSREDALHESIVWAGESITISGAAVIIGFGSMSVCSYSMISTMGLCLALGIIVALIAALTLVPSILAVVGDRIFWPTTMKAFEEGGKATKGWYAWFGRRGQSYFHKSAHFSLKHAWAIVIAALVVTAPAAYVVANSETSYDMITTMLAGEAGEGMQLVSTYADQGLVMPDYVLIEYTDDIATVIGPEEDALFGTLTWSTYWTETVLPSLLLLKAGLSEDDNISYTQLPFVWDAINEEVKKSGITDVDKKIELVKSLINTKYSMYFDAVVALFDNTDGLKKDYIFDGPGAMMEDSVKSLILCLQSMNLDWDAAVAEAKAAGYTKTDDIIHYVAYSQVKSANEEVKAQTILGVVDTLEAMGISKDIMVNGFAAQIEGALYLALPEQYMFEFDWNQSVADAKEKGITDPDQIILYIASSIEAAGGAEKGPVQKQYFLGVIQAFNEKKMTNDLLVNGVGSNIEMALFEVITEASGLEVKWDQEVAAAKAAGVKDPEMIVKYIVDKVKDQSAIQGAMFEGVVSAITGTGLTADVLVNGFGPILDYVVNISDSMVGGAFVTNKENPGTGAANYIKLSVATKAPAMSNRSMDTIKFIDKTVDDYVGEFKSDVKQTWNTGSAVLMYDVSQLIKEQFIYIEVLLVVLIIILLFVVMRSYLIPIRSVLTIGMSIVWTLAITHLVFTELLGYDILWMIPLILLALCLGLGMDYDILLTTRIKENVMNKKMSNDDAIYDAVTHTGSVITICGLIMGGAFGTLMLSSMPLLQMIGFALCFAILVDALLVRTYIVPAIMHLLGDWNWKGPGYKKRMQRFGRS